MSLWKMQQQAIEQKLFCFQNISKYILFLFRPMEVFGGVSGWKKLEV